MVFNFLTQFSERGGFDGPPFLVNTEDMNRTDKLDKIILRLYPFMRDGSWYTSEKLRFISKNTLEFDTSSTLSKLYLEGYVIRKESKRILFKDTYKMRRRYKGKWAYKLKPEFISDNYKQLTLDL